MGGTGGQAVSIKVAVAGLVMSLASGAALAQPDLMPPTTTAPIERPQTATRSYGLQIFAADGLLAAVALGTGRAEPVLGLALTGPIVHAVHGRGGAAVGSETVDTSRVRLQPAVGVTRTATTAGLRVDF